MCDRRDRPCGREEEKVRMTWKVYVGSTTVEVLWKELTGT